MEFSLLTPTTVSLSGTATVGLGVTITIPAAAAGTFNYLLALEINMFAAALLVAAATPVLVTTTGITGTPTFSLEASAQAQGTIVTRIYQFVPPIKGSAAATAITVVAPAVTNVIWRLNAQYFQL
jgi:hypothetical protein